MRRCIVIALAFAFTADTVISAQEWPLWRSYAARFLDDQVRVIDRDAGDRTTSEGQAYAMFFSLVANDRSRFDRLLAWSERNLAGGDLGSRLPSWLWGRAPDGEWRVLDANSASDADVWMAYTLLEAGDAWGEPRYRQLGGALAARIAEQEVAHIPNVGVTLTPGARGFQKDETYRLNPSYLTPQLFARLAELLPEGPWREMAPSLPALIEKSAPRGFAMDWMDVDSAGRVRPSELGSYDAIRVYLWVGLLHADAREREPLLRVLSGMTGAVRSSGTVPEKVRTDGRIDSAKGPVGFSAALIPFLTALGEQDLASAQLSRVRAELDASTGLFGKPAKYYDQNLALFALGSLEGYFWFDAHGRLRTRWKPD
ncbi:MAG TPA: cellulose synthase complex periplasmic endoglucanase BcsZ [Vicinamibacterales bacterium]|nr:cellulose synthase complex periplasmic endoglucanase BcsZ [Vicinamibacterales bacterium]